MAGRLDAVVAERLGADHPFERLLDPIDAVGQKLKKAVRLGSADLLLLAAHVSGRRAIW